MWHKSGPGLLTNLTTIILSPPYRYIGGLKEIYNKAIPANTEKHQTSRARPGQQLNVGLKVRPTAAYESVTIMCCVITA